MAFVRERIPMEKREFVNKYMPKMQFSKYSSWKVDYEREAYWLKDGQNALEHLEYYMLIWKGKKIFVDTYGWFERFGDMIQGYKNIILFQGDASLKKDKEELIQIVQEALECGYDNDLTIKEMVEPDFSREIQ